MKRFAVIGLGRFGRKLAVSLAASGAEVIAIDRDKEVVEQIRDQVGQAVRLDSTDERALKSQSIDKVDVAVVGFGTGSTTFETAILTVASLKAIGVKHVFARAQTQLAGQVFTKVGADEIIYPEIESAQRWAYKLIAPQVSDKIDFAPGYSLARINAPPSFDMKTVVDLQLRYKYNVNLISVKRIPRGVRTKEEIISVPMPNTVIYAGDILMVAGSDADLAKFPQE
jgi:trk system potassium uptake protein